MVCGNIWAGFSFVHLFSKWTNQKPVKMKDSSSYRMARFISATCKMQSIEPISQVRIGSLGNDHFYLDFRMGIAKWDVIQ